LAFSVSRQNGLSSATRMRSDMISPKREIHKPPAD
jgi:hypothetical protein